MRITGKKRGRRPCRGGSTSERHSTPKRDPPPDSYSPVGGVQSTAEDPVGSVFLPDSVGSNSTRRSARLLNRVSPLLRRFRHFLHGHCERVADEMWESNTFEMEIRFSTIRAHHKQLSEEMVNNHRKMGAELHSALVDYLIMQFMKKDFAQKFVTLDDMVYKIRENAKLALIDVPERIEPIEDVFDIPLQGPWKRTRLLFAEHPQRKFSVPITTDSHLRILIGSFDHLLNSHKEGKSWGGAWTRNNWDVADGRPCLYAPAEPGDANQASCKLDLVQWSTEFLTPLCDRYGRYPANIEHLLDELNDPLDLPDDEFFGWYYEFLANHPCLFTGSARKMLVTGWYHLVKYLGYGQKDGFKRVFDYIYHWTSPFLNKVDVDIVLWHVFWNKKTPGLILPYKDTLGQNFLLMRQLQEHVYRKTKKTGDIQTVERIEDTDLYAEDQFPHILAEVIKLLFLENKMVGEFLEQYEDFKKLRGPRSERGG